VPPSKTKTIAVTPAPKSAFEMSPARHSPKDPDTIDRHLQEYASTIGVDRARLQQELADRCPAR
jgi:hypothetical protein